MTIESSEQREVSDLRTEATLAAGLVHKRAPEQVFVTDWMEGPGETMCTIAARLPLAHGRFSDGTTPYHDIVLVAETIRQAGLIITSQVFDIPAERQFLLRELRVELDPLELSRRAPESCEMTIWPDPSSTVKMRRGGDLAGGMMMANCEIGGQRAATGQVVGAWVTDDAYVRLRDSQRIPDAPPAPAPLPVADREHACGKRNPANSVLSPLRKSGDGYAATIVVDRDDPTWFDHPLDHVPGLLLLEAFQQATVAAACAQLGVTPDRVAVERFALRFSRIVEFSPDCDCTVELDETRSEAQVRSVQNDRSTSNGTLGFRVL